MNWPPKTVAACLVAASVAWTAPATGSDDPFPGEPTRARDRELFEKKVYPILESRCFRCHGDGEDLGGELDLRSREAMLRGGKNGPALVPGDPEASQIFQSLRKDEASRMPPKEYDRLAPEEVASLKGWIESGAAWTK